MTSNCLKKICRGTRKVRGGFDAICLLEAYVFVSDLGFLEDSNAESDWNFFEEMGTTKAKSSQSSVSMRLFLFGVEVIQFQQILEV